MSKSKSVSYSQFNMYRSCPRQWKLTYIDKVAQRLPSIYTVFGTAIHECIQEYLDVMYSSSIKEANKLGLHIMLKEKMTAEYSREYKKLGSHFSTPSELAEFYQDGINILEYFVKKRGGYFSKRNCELLGIEKPINIVSEVNENVRIKGFIDLVMREGDRIKIYDIKTSSWGWKPNKKKQEGDQLRIYKKYFAKQYGYDESKIDIEYFIVKRKLYENSDFPQRRIQIHRPPHGKPSMNKTSKVLDTFISEVFNNDGSYNVDRDYPALKTGCTYCPFKNDNEMCPSKIRQWKN